MPLLPLRMLPRFVLPLLPRRLAAGLGMPRFNALRPGLARLGLARLGLARLGAGLLLGIPRLRARVLEFPGMERARFMAAELPLSDPVLRRFGLAFLGVF